MSYLEYEIDLNDAKREINVLQPRYVEIYLRDMANIMEYKRSQKFISRSLKKTENPRIISP